MSDWTPLLLFGTCMWFKLVLSSRIYSTWLTTDNVVQLSAFATVALLLGPLCLLPAVPRLVCVLGANLAISLMLLADTIYFRRFLDIITVADLSGAHQLLMAYVIAAIVQLLQIGDALYFVDIALGLLLAPFYWWLYRFRSSHGFTTRIRIAVVVLVLGGGASVPAARLAVETIATANGNLFRSRLVGTIGLVPYHTFDVFTHVTHLVPEPEEPSIDQMRQFIDRHRQHGKSEVFGLGKGRNVILIQAESLLAFPIGLVIDGQPVAPNLSAFAAESIGFKNFFDQTHSGGTSDGEFTALNSLHPLPEGAVPYRFQYNHFVALPQILSDLGYATLSACAAAGLSYDMNLMHPTYGFHTSFFEPDFEDRERFYWIADRPFFSQMLSRLTEQRTPFFAFLVTSSNHSPYAEPAKRGGLRVPPALQGTDLGDYLGSVHYFDQAFGELIEGLRQRGLLDTSVIALYGDHTGLWEVPKELPALLRFPTGSQYDERLALTRLPFLIRLPQGQAASRRDAASGHLDIAPTILGLVGVDDGERLMLGRDLMREGKAMVAFRDGSFADDHVLFINSPVAREIGCFDRASGRSLNCKTLETQRREALDRLTFSDSVLRRDLVPVLTRSKPVLTLRDLMPPKPLSAELGLDHVVFLGIDMYAHPPSGATFSVPGGRIPIGVEFSPDFASSVTAGQTDGVTFELWTGGKRVYGRHVMPGEHLNVALELPLAQDDHAEVTFVTTVGPRGRAEFDRAVWKNVRFFVGEKPHLPRNLGTKNPPIRLVDLASPMAFSAELGLASVRVVGADLEMQPPGGATFSVCTSHRALQVVFSPAYKTGPSTEPTSEATFQVWNGSTRLFEKRIHAGEKSSPIAIDVPEAASADHVAISLVIPTIVGPQQQDNLAVWQDVRLVLAGPKAECLR